MSLNRLLLDAGLYALLASIYLLLMLRLNPRLFLQDYPPAIQERVPPKTVQEKWLALLIGLPFLLLLMAGPWLSTLALDRRLGGQVSFLELFLNALGVAFAFNLADWLILDWAIFCAWTPRFLVIPGTEGMPAYKDYGYHFRGFVIGAGFSLIYALFVSGLIAWL